MSRTTSREDSTRTSAAPRGTWLVVGLVLLGVAAAVTGIWFQRHQTRQCLEFYGATAARRIASAPKVELLLVQPGVEPGRLVAHVRLDVSKAPGLVHLRRGLVEDANFNWSPADREGDASVPPRLPSDAWDVAFVFAEPLGSTTVVIDLDPSGGSLAVVGQTGRIGLGRIGPGLEKWIRSTMAADR